MSANQAASGLRQDGPMHPGSGITAFLVIAFGFAWAIWLPMWILGVPSGSTPAQVGQVAGSFSPAVAAVAVRHWVTREGFADAGLRPRLRQAARYYLFSWLFPVPFLAAAAVLATVFGLTVHWSDFGTVLGALATVLALTPVIFGEEFGWRSYLQPRLLASRPTPHLTRSRCPPPQARPSLSVRHPTVRKQPEAALPSMRWSSIECVDRWVGSGLPFLCVVKTPLLAGAAAVPPGGRVPQEPRHRALLADDHFWKGGGALSVTV